MTTEEVFEKIKEGRMTYAEFDNWVDDKVYDAIETGYDRARDIYGNSGYSEN